MFVPVLLWPAIFSVLHQIQAPLVIGVALWQIYARYSNAMFGAIGGLIFFLILNVLQGKLMGNIRGKVAVMADKRIKLLGEMIKAMRVVKMYVWEGHFVKKLIQGKSYLKHSKP